MSNSSEFTVAQNWQANHDGPAKWVFSHALRQPFMILGTLGGATGNAVLAALVPLLIGRAYHAIQAAPPDLSGLKRIAWIIVISQVARGLILQMARNLCSETLGQRIERDIRQELYLILIGKSMSFHDSHPTVDLMARATNDVRQINLMFNPGLNLVIGSANFFLMPLFVAPTIHPQLILTPLIYLIAYGFVVRDYLRQLRPVSAAVRQEFGNVNTALAEAIEGIETVKGSAQEEYETSRFRRAISKWRQAYIAQAEIEAQFVPLLMLGLLQAAGMFHSLWLMRSGAIDVGDVLAFNGLLLLFGFPTWAAQFAYSRVASGLASARRILELITARSDLGQNEAGYQQPMRGAVSFDQVTFHYAPDEEAILTNLNFQVEPGQTIAVVGQTGSGKSTIAKLLNRIYDVQRGVVRIDGVDVRDWNLAALRRQISIIEQDLYLFSRTIAENIAFGCPEAGAEEIIAAAQAAQADEFIMNFSAGYETVIGERGTTLSGGQRQRIALARAFLTDPAILILDDATSAIDSETEDRIQRAIERAAANRTTFLITHRLSQIRWADQILVMRQGRIAASGTHEELMRSSEAYRDIFARYK
ncbi:MAG: ABC transporter ATP-binding protein/permease [Anaerolineae bacterium]|nr:ABC transporter ATP-binding protein/permease [Anaerolineae bacterium]